MHESDNKIKIVRSHIFYTDMQITTDINNIWNGYNQMNDDLSHIRNTSFKVKVQEIQLGAEGIQMGAEGIQIGAGGFQITGGPDQMSNLKMLI
jgi:hypothetical protein